MSNLTRIRKWNYGDYSSSNYGAHSIAIEIGNLTIYFSYDTVVAFRSLDAGLVVIQNYWSTTTGKHLNTIDGGDKKSRVTSEEFEKKLAEVLKVHNLSI